MPPKPGNPSDLSGGKKDSVLGQSKGNAKNVNVPVDTDDDEESSSDFGGFRQRGGRGRPTRRQPDPRRSAEDYKLLEAMNNATVTKYTDMQQIATNIGKSLHELNSKYESLRPMLEQIDQIEDSVSKLEQAAYKLDNYSKRLEAKFKALEKR
ncbi:hypothetical protein GE061_013212 [Apolygus lucorum]|uniref:Biogenesis of lysosome-related organelles complex 1 subunit 2 n=1 Tax=Apolygus lucorum TaxID=248454 RepID=A0A8S9XX71_APOLU|nr:hypothetical protein GE061_013212 [Apolygus lucorum]